MGSYFTGNWENKPTEAVRLPLLTEGETVNQKAGEPGFLEEGCPLCPAPSPGCVSHTMIILLIPGH